MQSESLTITLIQRVPHLMLMYVFQLSSVCLKLRAFIGRTSRRSGCSSDVRNTHLHPGMIHTLFRERTFLIDYFFQPSQTFAPTREPQVLHSAYPLSIGDVRDFQRGVMPYNGQARANANVPVEQWQLQPQNGEFLGLNIRGVLQSGASVAGETSPVSIQCLLWRLFRASSSRTAISTT